MRARELRRKAAVARRAASVPTSGSRQVDRLLLLLAARLEHDASFLEQEGRGGIEGPGGEPLTARSQQKPAGPQTKGDGEKGEGRG